MNTSTNIEASADFITKMQQKIQQQAQRLQAEAQYRLLCEKRIKKLDPEHPLPVQFEHLDKPAFTPPGQTSQNSSGAPLGSANTTTL